MPTASPLSSFWNLFRSESSRRTRRVRRRSNGPQRTPAATESLEARQLLTVFTWDAGGDGISFQDKDNWAVDGQLQPDAAPGVNDDVVIDLDAGEAVFTVRVTGNEEVNSLTLNSDDAVLQLSNGGSLTVTTDTIVQEGKLFAIGGDLTTDGLVNDAQIHIAASGTVIDAASFENHGDFDVTRSGGISATLVNGFTNFGNVTLDNTSASSSGGVDLKVQNGTVVNTASGTIDLVDGPGSRIFEFLALDNAGTVNLDDADVRLQGDAVTISNTGDVNIAPGSLVNTFVTSVTVNQNGGNLNADGRLVLNNGTLNVTGGNVTINDDISVDRGAMNQSGGSIRNDGRFAVTRSDANFTGGDLIGANSLVLTGNEELTITHDGSFSAEISNNRTVNGTLFAGQSLTVNAQNCDIITTPGFVNHGTITFDNPGVSAQELRTSDGSAFENAADGTLRFTRSASQNVIGTFISAPINNAGTIEIDAIVSDGKANTLTNTGTFVVTADGRYTRSTAGGVQNPFDQAGGTLTIDADGSFDGGGLEFNFNGGTVDGLVQPRTLNLNSGSTGTGTFKPTREFSGDVKSGQEIIVDRDVEVVGAVNNSGLITLVNTNDDAALEVGAEPLINTPDGQIIINGAAGLNHVLRGQIINSGLIDLSGGSLTVFDLTNRNEFNIAADSVASVAQNAAFRQDAGLTTVDGRFTVSRGGIFNYGGGSIDGSPIEINRGGVDFGPQVGAHEFLILGSTGEFLSDISPGVTVTLSNRESATTSQTNRTPENFTVHGTLIVGDDLTTGDEILVGANGAAGVFEVGPTGIVEINGAVGDRFFNKPLINRGQIEANAAARFGVGLGINRNFGSLHNNDQTITFFGDELINENGGEITGTGTLSFVDGPFLNRPTAFTNDGTLSVGQSPGTLSFLVDTFTQTAGGNFVAELENALSDLVDGPDVINLAGNLDILPLPGHDSNTHTRHQIMGATNAVNGQFDTVSVVGALDNQAFSVQQDDTSVSIEAAVDAADLELLNFNFPATAKAGDSVTISWEVRNNGRDTTAGSWFDTIFFSPTSDFNNATSIPLIRLERTGNLAPGESYVQTAQVTVPGTFGETCFHARANSSNDQIETDAANNIQRACCDVDMDELNRGNSITRFIAAGERLYFKVPVTANELNRVDLLTDDTSAVTSSVSFRQFHDGFNSDRTCEEFDEGRRCQWTRPETGFVIYEAVGQESAGTGEEVTIFYRTDALAINQRVFTNIFTGTDATLPITGFGFTEDTQVFLRDVDGNLFACDFERITGNSASIRTPGGTYSSGIYDILLRNSVTSEEAECTQCVHAEDEQIAPSELHRLNGPSSIRRQRVTQFTVDTNNDGNQDQQAGIKIVTVQNGVISDSPTAANDPRAKSQIAIFVADFSGADGVIGPGSSVETPIFVKGTSNEDPLIEIFEVDESTPITREFLKTLLPIGMTEEQIDALAPVLQQKTGDTVGELNEMLRDFTGALQEDAFVNPNQPPSLDDLISSLVNSVDPFGIIAAGAKGTRDANSDFALFEVSDVGVPINAEQTISITGKNFGDDTGVKIGGQMLDSSNVTLIDEGELQVVVPASQFDDGGGEALQQVTVIQNVVDFPDVFGPESVFDLNFLESDSFRPDTLQLAEPLSALGLGAIDPFKFDARNFGTDTTVFTIGGEDIPFTISPEGRLETPVPLIANIEELDDGSFNFVDQFANFKLTADGVLESATDLATGDILKPFRDLEGQLTALIDQFGNIDQQIVRGPDDVIAAVIQGNDVTSFDIGPDERLRAIEFIGDPTQILFNSPESQANNIFDLIELRDRQIDRAVNGDGVLERITIAEQQDDGSFLDSLIDVTVGESGLNLGASFQRDEPEPEQSVEDLLDQIEQALKEDRFQGLGVSELSVEQMRRLFTLLNKLEQSAGSERLRGFYEQIGFKNSEVRKLAATTSGAFANFALRRSQQLFSKIGENLDEFPVATVGAIDPNDIIGPEGFGAYGFVPVGQKLDYTINFENLETATAAAQEVFITQTLDADLDLDTFEFGFFGFRDRVFNLAGGQQSFRLVLNDQAATGLDVLVQGELDRATREVRWTFRSLDPRTGDLTSDVFAGFLPPDINDGEGEGFVTYSVKVREDAQSGTRIDAEASIVFDLNDAIATPPIFNTVDAGTPIATVDALPAEAPTPDFSVSWTGADDAGGSGVATFDVFMSEDGGPFELFLENTTDTFAVVNGEDGKAYSFRAVATDNVGFVEDDPGVAESSTVVNVNGAPTAVDDTFVGNEDTTISGNVLANDSDPDDDALTVALVDEPTNGTVVLNNDGSLEYFPGPNFNGDDSFTYSITDLDGERDTATVTISVNAVNDAPTVAAPIADVTVDEDAANEVIDLSGVFDDIDSAILTLTAVSSDGTLVNTSLNGTDLTLSFTADQNGAAAVTVTADDGEFTVSDTFAVTVNAVNDAPTVAVPLADVAVDEDASDQVVDLSGAFGDIDSANLTLTAVSSDGTLVTTSLNGTDLTLFFAANQNGAATVTVTADDGEFTVSDTFAVTVNAVNDAPTVAVPLADITVDEDAANEVIDLSGVFDDIDSANLTLTAVSSDGTLVSTSLNGTDLTLSFAADQNGAATVTVTADDGDLTVSDTFAVTVNAVNDTPTVAAPLADVTVDEDVADEVIDLSGVFDDIDSTNLTLTAVSDDGQLVSTSLNGTDLTLSFAADQNGAATVTVTAGDGEFTVSDTFAVTVNQINDAGTFGGDLTATVEAGNSARGTATFSDAVDGFSVPNFVLNAAANNGTATINADGTWNYSPNADFSGTDTFAIEVTDDDGNVESRVIAITVTPDGGGGNDDPVRLENGVLIIEGDQSDTNLKDRIRIRRTGGDNLTVKVRSGNDAAETFTFPIADVDSIRITAGDGNDRIRIDDDVLIPVEVDGGAGNDVIQTGGGDDTIVDMFGNNEIWSGAGNDVINTGDGHDWIDSGSGNDLVRAQGGCNVIYAGSGHDIVVGGSGYDLIFGGSGRDILIGGDRSDVIFGGSGQDILIGGWTAHDNYDEALNAIRDEWTSDRSIRTRVRNIWNGSGSTNRANANFFLNNSTIFNDNDYDLLFGGYGTDWYPGC